MILMLRKIGLIFCFLLATLDALYAQQPTREDLQKQKQQIQKEIDELRQSLNSIQGDKSKALKAFSIATRKIEAREKLINNINHDIKRLDENIFENQREIYRLRKELDTLKQQYAQSIVFAYKSRSNYGYLNFLFSATNFNDAVKRIAYLKSYRQFRQTQAQTITKTQDFLQQKIGTLNSNRTEMNIALQSQSNELKDLEQDKIEKDQVVKQLKGQEKEISAQLKKREKQRQELNRAIEVAIRKEILEAERRDRIAKQKAAEEKKRKQEELAAKAKADAAALEAKNKADGNNKPKPSNTPSPTATISEKEPAKTNRTYSPFESTAEGLTQSINFENSKGRLPWPVSSGDVSHKFGKEQVGPQMTIENNGISIALEVGATVKCVADGEVISVMDLNEYQAVLVRHGRYFTTYNKLSSVNVSKGQQLNAGTLVGKAAQDFNGGGEIEFRVMDSKGRYFNPESWLKPR